jgi:hypothetical protein
MFSFARFLDVDDDDDDDDNNNNNNNNNNRFKNPSCRHLFPVNKKQIQV